MNLRRLGTAPRLTASPPPTRTGPRPLVLCKCGERALVVHRTRGPLCLECWLGTEASQWLVSAMLRGAKEDFGR